MLLVFLVFRRVYAIIQLTFMSAIAKILLRLIANFVGLQIAINYISGVSFSGQFLDLAKAAAIITLLNILLKPFLEFILAPFIFITLGFFGLVINALMLWLATYWAPQLDFSSLGVLLLTTLIITFINYLFDIVEKKND
ncbi:MAG: Membrane spanning protein [Parcubacteria group bacterium GW2011_GWC1_45_9]|nr:MAG: Membrane spanning protein [Parcubacteria group bacterium GW2011_GWB1_45_10]KKU17398.1 MAG: Membrane spanning protein [Parcubacteria group bacterium GW2011_GWC1_45_9]